MSEIKPLRNYYVILHDRTKATDYSTISSQKKSCIKNFLHGTKLTWKEYRKYGWRCVKVAVLFTIIH